MSASSNTRRTLAKSAPASRRSLRTRCSTWPGVGRVAIHHRTGTLHPTECSVMIAVSASHRGDAFDAAQHCIDTLKRTVPIWKREKWTEGDDWGLDAHEIDEVGV